VLGLFKPLERVAFGDKNYPNCDTSTSFFRSSEAGRFIKSDCLMSSAAKPDDPNIGDAFYVTLVDKKEQIGLARPSLTRRLACRARDSLRVHLAA
jgi:hypothetical protein